MFIIFSNCCLDPSVHLMRKQMHVLNMKKSVESFTVIALTLQRVGSELIILHVDACSYKAVPCRSLTVIFSKIAVNTTGILSTKFLLFRKTHTCFEYICNICTKFQSECLKLRKDVILQRSKYNVSIHSRNFYICKYRFFFRND